ncbi:hypothetical protein E2C01_059176 [Portunus trituberculatus]|uniref:Uncharacterized protein n=1 Tax=Portunus trituberculatus TaxID=210409 RepID=A0A5B7H1U9_PORTR|nr:hypothetical protein [Portunus trituberculatus]
MSPRKWKGSA